MHYVVDKITNYCIRRNIINEDSRIWFQYGIEKRLSTIIVAVPFFLLAILLTNFITAIAFYFSFYWLRSRINGFHAKTVGLCFAVSLLTEFLYCGVLYNMLFRWDILIHVVFSTAIIFFFAPFKQPHLNLSETDVAFCKKQARIRSLCLSAFSVILLITGCLEAAKGVVLGSSMAALMLIIPYISQKRSSTT